MLTPYSTHIGSVQCQAILKPTKSLTRLPLHPAEGFESPLRLSSAFTGADECVIRPCVWRHGGPTHRAAEIPGVLPSRSSSAGADQRVVGFQVRLDACLLHLEEILHRLLPFAGPLTTTDEGCEGDHIWPNTCKRCYSDGPAALQIHSCLIKLPSFEFDSQAKHIKGVKGNPIRPSLTFMSGV